jgi:FtsP/CotA-like multicopper oxidase with cupredoxin domain
VTRTRIISAVVAVTVTVGVGLVAWGSRGNPVATLEAVDPAGAEVEQAEAARRGAAPDVVEVELIAGPAEVTLEGRTVRTWAFNGEVPGPEIRLVAGDVLRAVVENRLPQSLTIHWHGVALRNDMDGVPGVTQPAIAPGGTFVYEFAVPDPGTFFYHPHTGTQLDTGLYAPLIVEDPAETERFDADVAVLIDDWVDGVGDRPDAIFERLSRGMGAHVGDPTDGDEMEGMDGHDMGAMDGMGEMGGSDGGQAAEGSTDPSGPSLGSDVSDVRYQLYVLNGRDAADPMAVDVWPGDRVRLRVINVGADTPFRIGVPGTPLTALATDGFPVEPQVVDSILVGMGERVDVEVTVPRSGAALVAEPEGATGRATLLLGSSVRPADAEAPLPGEATDTADLVSAPAVTLPAASPDRTYDVRFTGTMGAYDWSLDATEQGGLTMPVGEGERVRLTFRNDTAMWHPIHLHGHTFQVRQPDGSAGPRKDTVIVRPGAAVVVEFDADNPGVWALHCHNIYHAEAGMVTTLSYVR